MSFGGYLFQLIRSALGAAEGSDLARWAHTLGVSLDELKEAVFRVRRAWVVQTASGEALDAHGRDRGLPRHPGEPDDLYRRRLLAAYQIYAAGGTRPGMQAALAALGYPDAKIHELYKDGVTTPLFNGQHQYNGTVQHRGGVRWSEFKVITDIEPGRTFRAADAEIVLQAIRRMKPAHTRLVAFVLDTLLGTDYLSPSDEQSLNASWSRSDELSGRAGAHDAEARHGGQLRYGPWWQAEEASFGAGVVLTESLAGLQTYAIASRHDGGGARFRHAGSLLRRGWVHHDGALTHGAGAAYAAGVARYGDRLFTHNGVRTYGFGRTHGGWPRAGEGPADGMRLTVRRHGQVITDEVA